MSGIFISYANEDRQKAEALARALEQKGWSVWWDRKIPFGQSFDQVIEANLASAKCVLVLWTKVSVESRWVRSEASEAAGREVLVPVLFEPGVKIPLEFRLLQAVNLCEWHAGAEHKDFETLLAQIETMLTPAATGREHRTPDGQQPAVRASDPLPPTPASAEGQTQPVAAARTETDDRGRAEQPATRPAPDRSTAGARRLRHLIAFFLVPSALIIGAALALMGWHVPTRVQLEVVVDHVSFTLGGGEAVDVPERAVNFRSLSIENFDRVVFTPKRLAVRENSVDRVARAPEAVGATSTPAEVILTGATGERSLLTFEGPDSDAGTVGRMQAISGNPGTKVSLETSPALVLGFTLRMDGQALSTNVLPAGDLLLSASRATIQGVGAGVRAVNSSTLQVKLPEDSPFFRLEGARRFFVVSATLSERTPLLLVNQAPIAELELLKQSPGGAVASALVAAGEVRYPDYPKLPPRMLSASDFLALGDLDRAWITYLRLNPEKAAMDLRVEGVAGRIDRSSRAVKEDLRLTAFDTLWYRARAVVLLAIIAWAASISVGSYMLYTNSRNAR